MGSNIFKTKNPGEIISSDDPNQYKTGLTGNVYPRTVSGVVTDLAGSIGSSIYRWANFFTKILYIGEADSNLVIQENATNMEFSVDGTTAMTLTPDGWDGSYIKDATIPNSKRILNFVTAARTLNDSTGSTSYVDVDQFIGTITTSGRPVLVMAQDGYLQLTGIIGTSEAFYVRVVRDSTALNDQKILGYNGFGAPYSSFSLIDYPAAGTYVYKIQVKVTAGTLNKTPGTFILWEL